MSQSIALTRVLRTASSVAETHKVRACIVGGIVRDALSHGRIGDADLDLVVEPNGIEFARALHRVFGGEVTVHNSFLTAKIRPPFDTLSDAEAFTFALPQVALSEVDVATARAERYSRSGSLPEVVPATIEQDLIRRDFSINALAVPVEPFERFCVGTASREELRAAVIDPCDGLSDLDAGVIRILHRDSFVDDPTRLFRALRYSKRLRSPLSPETALAFTDAVSAGVLANLSVKRIWNELVAMACEGEGAEMIEAAVGGGLLNRAPFKNPEAQMELSGAVARIRTLSSSAREIASKNIEVVLAAVLVRFDGIESIRDFHLSKGVKRDIVEVTQSPCNVSEDNEDRVAVLRRTVWG